MKAISMKCSEEQFNKIRPILENNGLLHDIKNFDEFPYLVNDSYGEFGKVSNWSEASKYMNNREAFEKWDEKIFLEYCDIKEDYVFPDKWCIQDCREVTDFAMEYFGCNNEVFSSYLHVNGQIVKNNTFYAFFAAPHEDYKQITIEQFRKYLLNLKMKKPIMYISGYIAPIDLFKGKVKAGTLYKLVKNVEHCYEPADISASNTFYLPKEIVETWEPVKVESFKVGDYLYIIDSGCNITGCINGYVGKIKEIANSNSDGYDYIYRFEDGSSCSSRAVKTRLATKEEIEKLNSAVFKIGVNKSIEVVVKYGEIHCGSENITEAVKSMYEYYYTNIASRSIMTGKSESFGGYIAKPEDIIFSRTGCKYDETKLSEWIQIYDEYKRQSLLK